MIMKLYSLRVLPTIIYKQNHITVSTINFYLFVSTKWRLSVATGLIKRNI